MNCKKKQKGGNFKGKNRQRGKKSRNQRGGLLIQWRKPKTPRWLRRRQRGGSAMPMRWDNRFPFSRHRGGFLSPPIYTQIGMGLKKSRFGEKPRLLTAKNTTKQFVHM